MTNPCKANIHKETQTQHENIVKFVLQTTKKITQDTKMAYRWAVTIGTCERREQERESSLMREK